jgi:hypothetical protein
MTFFRPEAMEAITRWRETIIGVFVAGLGSVWMITSFGAVQILGTVMAVVGVLLIAAGIQRGRFRRSSLGPGLVTLLEGQLTYYGPTDGGAVFINDIRRLEIFSDRLDKAAWVVHHDSGPPLHIPVDAAGAENLFDVFSNLPGLNTRNLLDNLRSSPDGLTLIWDRDPPRLH